MLRDFLPRFNARFACATRASTGRGLPPSGRMTCVFAETLCFKHTRKHGPGQTR